ncbi:MAG: RNA polymerase factor sigma-54 [candidate division KSB1 bacterium]|nr:RNA polymerase factor sigma-54 [candidate division KSB1 bacterium]
MVRLGQQISLQMKQSPQQVLLSSLLQLPIMSLEQRLQTELEINPLLEIEQEYELEQQEEESALEDEAEEDNGLEQDNDEIDWDEILNDEDNYEYKPPREKKEDDNERVEVYQQTLTDHLIDQLKMSDLTPEQVIIGEYIIWNIDTAGYLRVSIENIAENLEKDSEAIEQVLSVIQQFDPPGIGARNLQECLLIQLHQQDPVHAKAIEMIRDQFDDFKNKRYEKLSKNMDTSLERVKDTIDHIIKLNPKPGEGYISLENNYIVPDVEVRKEEGEFRIYLNDYNIPHLQINQQYKKMMLDKKKTSKETRDFIRQRLESARWLINSIHQRRATIMRTVEAIITRQYDFFEKGPNYLKPMILKDIADDINMDISTISRVTNGKYIQTEYGIFELKYFFSEKYRTDDGEDVSNKKIKMLIKDLIDTEPAGKPYNDQKISDMLKEQGFPVARRTVAKYREQMNIPVARMRRSI